VATSQSAVQYDFHTKAVKFDIPACNEWVEKRYAVFNRNVEDIRVQKVKNHHSRLFIAPLADSGYAMNPLFVFKLFFRHSLGHIEKLLGDKAFELAERLPLEDAGDLFPLRGYAFSKNELAEFLKERAWWI
jgi:hypothetical protein